MIHCISFQMQAQANVWRPIDLVPNTRSATKSRKNLRESDSSDNSHENGRLNAKIREHDAGEEGR